MFLYSESSTQGDDNTSFLMISIGVMSRKKQETEIHRSYIGFHISMMREYMDQHAVVLSVAFLSDTNPHNDNTRLKNRVSTLSLAFSSPPPPAPIRHFTSVWSNLSLTFWRILFATASAMTSVSRSHSSLFISVNCSVRSPRAAWSRPTIFPSFKLLDVRIRIRRVISSSKEFTRRANRKNCYKNLLVLDNIVPSSSSVRGSRETKIRYSNSAKIGGKSEVQ